MLKLNSYLTEFNIEDKSSYDVLTDKIANTNIVLLGESTHGSLEFYTIRSTLSKYLIENHNFDAICIEGDWPSSALINSYIHGLSDIKTPELALAEFNRFPQWMWKNPIILDLISWLRKYNDKDHLHKVDFYGLDLYSLESSINAVINYLKKTDPEAAEIAIKNYSCFENTLHDPREYGALIKYQHKKPCIDAVIEELNILREKSMALNSKNVNEMDRLFFATQNANLIKNAEHYYRALFDYTENTWNIRDQHMFETLNNVIAHLEKKLLRTPKIIIWAHNSHIGNAQATEVNKYGEINIGQLVKEAYPKNSYALGFSTFSGVVTAANNWGDEPHYKQMKPALPDSYEFLFHQLPFKNFLLDLTSDSELKEVFGRAKLQRAIGVVYKPDNEKLSHYYMAKLSQQFDSIIHIDYTNAITPL